MALPFAGPRVAVAPGGAFVVTYPSTGIKAVEFDRTCKAVGTPFAVNTTIGGLQDGPAIAAGTDRFVVAWHTANLDSDGLAVARRLYRFRSIFADDFEPGNTLAWSAAVP